MSAQPNNADAISRARELLDQGITDQNYIEAIQLLLIIQSDYDPNSSAVETPAWFRVVLWGGLLTSIVLSFKPKITLGIGRGNELITRWKIWLQIVGITIPGLLFGSFIWPTIVDWIRTIFT